MKILVATASKHESTLGIAEAIAAELRLQGYAVDVGRIDGATSANTYDAAVVGSAVYMGKWLPEAVGFVNRNHDLLTKMPVWLFSSGPLGWGNPEPAEGTIDLDRIVASTGARGHHVFVGKLDKHELGLFERLAVKAVKAPEGDFRDWPEIRAWARGIGDALVPRPVLALDVTQGGETRE